MIITYAGKNVQVTEAMKELAEKKLSKLDKFFRDDVPCKVTFSQQRAAQLVEITIGLPGTFIRAEESSNDLQTAVDKAVEVLSRQVRKHKTKLEKKYRGNNESIRFENIPVNEEADNDADARIIKTKSLELRPMSADEAILQLELVGHDFYMFKNSDNNEVNVVYKRIDKGYGLLVPEL